MFSYVPTSDFDLQKHGCVVALGCFDGLHTGHRRLIALAKEEAIRLGLPLAVYSPEAAKGQSHLTTPEEKIALLQSLGADLVFLADFEKIREMTAGEFVSSVLFQTLHCRSAVCGYNFKFGKKAAGDASLLTCLLAEHGATVQIVPSVCDKGEPISSTRIRNLLKAGQIEDANLLLQRPYTISGTVEHGRALGRTLGFPTLNLSFPESKLVPCHGVYYSRVHTPMGIYGAITNIGIRPTYSDTPPAPVLESHLFNFQEVLYGSTVSVELISFIRKEMAFPHSDALKQAIEHDVLLAKSAANADPLLSKELT